MGRNRRTEDRQTYREQLSVDNRQVIVGLYEIDHNSRRVVRNLTKIEIYQVPELTLVNSITLSTRN